MKNIIKALLIVMTLSLVLVAFASCELECVHQGGEATCTEKAVCELCGESYGSALGHKDLFTGGLDATCTEPGYTVGQSCSVCGEVFVPVTDIPAQGHKMISVGYENGCEVFVCERECGHVETVEVQIPEVVVGEVEGADVDLTFALNFSIADLENLSDDYLNAVLEKYGNYYVDYVLTIEGLTSESVTFNANGEADGYLGGQYDEWSDNWVTVPFENVVMKNGDSLYIMEYAAELMGKAGLRYTLAEVVTAVVNFDCGVYFTPEFLEANPDMVVTLQLIVFTEDAEGNKTLLNGEAVAENVFTVAK